MKRLILSAVIASAVAVAASAVAQDKPQDPSQPEARQSTNQSQAPASSIHGTVVSVDQSGKSFVIKDEAGKETTVYWDSSTKMSGDLKAGSMVSIQTTDSGGKTMATSIDAKGAKKPY